MAVQLTGDLTSALTYAIYGSQSEFGPEDGPRQLTPTSIKPKYEARAAFELFKGAGIKILPVATDLDRVGDDKTYPSLAALPPGIDVLILALNRTHAVKAVEEASAAGIRCIWFGPSTDTPEALALCSEKGIRAVKGCPLTHRTVKGLTRFISPCFYMGLKATKLPVS